MSDERGCCCLKIIAEPGPATVAAQPPLPAAVLGESDSSVHVGALPLHGLIRECLCPSSK